MDSESNSLRTYKIEKGDVVRVYRTDYHGRAFYKLRFKKRESDGRETEGYKTITFKRGVDLPDETQIRILDFFENFYNKDRFTTIWTLMITDFEVAEIDKTMEEYAKSAEEDNF